MALFDQDVNKPSRTQQNAFLRALGETARREPWKRTLLQLAWTAGPVTYLALQGGYVIGYGQSAPPNLFIYFAFYTVIAGAASVVLRIIYNATRGERVNELQEKVDLVLDRLPDLIMHIRDHQLSRYTGEDRLHLAAKFLLENTDATEGTVHYAVYALTGDRKLAETAERIDILRKNGLASLVADEFNAIHERVSKQAEKLKTASAGLSDILLQRFKGDPPSTKRGRPRSRGFINRVLASLEEENLNLISLTDIEEMLTLAFEFVAGRRFKIFSIRYYGTTKFTESSGRVENARRGYRSATYKRNSIIRLIADTLSVTDYGDALPAANPALPEIQHLYEESVEAFDRLYASVKRKRNPVEIAIYRKVFGLFRILEQAERRVRQQRKNLERTLEKFWEIRAHYASEYPLNINKTGSRFKGSVRLCEREIELPLDRRLAFTESFFNLFNEVWWISPRPGVMRNLESYRKSERQIARLKKVAQEIARLLDREINLAGFQIQQSIESSRAPNLLALDTNLTTKTRIAWALSLVQDIRHDDRPLLYRMLRVLVDYHGVSLTEETIETLTDEYGLDRSVLEAMHPEPENVEAQELLFAPVFSVRPLDKKYSELMDVLR
ncbi:MAG: hypothetical protein ACLFRY_02995 [Spirochaetia bacterium]